MTPAYASVMARWMNEKLCAVSATMTDEERKLERGAFFGSVHRTLDHLLVTDRIWLARIEATPLEATPLESDELGPGGIRALDRSCTPTSPSCASSAPGPTTPATPSWPRSRTKSSPESFVTSGAAR